MLNDRVTDRVYAAGFHVNHVNLFQLL